MATENSNYYISSLLRKLQSSSSSSVQKALISLSRATRKSDNVVKLREEGGIQLLLTFVRSSNKKALDMAVSALANCALDGQCRTEIKELNGLALLCKVLASLADVSILSRVTRALANLSQDVSITNEIVNFKAVPKLLGILGWSTDVHLLQNTLRALRIMGRSYACTKELGESNGILSFVELLGKENGNEIKRCCLQTLLELTRAAHGVLATQFQEHGAIKVVSQLSYSDDKDLAENCINILCTLTRYSSVRVSVGTVGGIEAFIHQIQNRGPLLLPSIEGICMCCREAVNRNKVRSCGGLEVLLGILHCPEYSHVFDNVLGAFACFTYDDLALKRMLRWGLIPTLVSMLQKLLFPENTVKNKAGKQENDLLTSSDKTTATTIPKKNATSKSSESMIKPTANTPSSSTTSDSAKSITLAISPLHHASYPASPPTCLSPNLSPELRVPFMPPYSPQSTRSSSPMVYSPSGSEVDDDASSESDVNPEQDTVEDAGPRTEISQDPTAPKSDELTPPASNHSTMSKGSTGTSREEAGEGASPHNDSTATHENVLSTLMEDLATTHSRNMATAAARMFKKLDKTDKEHCQSLQNEESSFRQRVSRRRARVPLLHWTSFNEHRRLFLPDQNLFSADQPSLRKIQENPWSRRKSWRSYSRAHAPSSTSRGISKTSDSSPQSPSHSSGLEGIESKIILLLSRFGQMPDASHLEALTSPECIQTLLDYLCYSKNRDSRCERLFSRLAWDRKYFETFVVIMLPGAIYRQLICGLRPGYLLSNQSSTSTEESSVRTPEPITTHTLASVDHPAEVMPLACGSSTVVETNSLNTKSPEYKFPQGNPTCDSNPDSNKPVTLHQSTSDSVDVIENNQAGSKSSYLSPLTSKQQEQNVLHDATQGETMIRAENFPRNHTKMIGKSLLSVLTTQACTPFGEGILAHLLLRGTQKQMEACALSLPYVCKPLGMKQKLLVDHQGIMVILSMLCNSTEQADIIRAVNSITYLIANSALKMDKNFKVFIAKNESQFLIPRGYRVVDLLSTKTGKVDRGSTEIFKKESKTDAYSSRSLFTYLTSFPEGIERFRKTESLPKDNNGVANTGSTSEGRSAVESFSTTAGNGSNVARTMSRVYWRTEYLPKDKDSDGRRKFVGRTGNDGDIERTMYAVCRKTDRMSEVKDDGVVRGLASRRYRKFRSSMGEDDYRSSAKSKRLREVVGDFTSKKTKMGSCSTVLETCSAICSYDKTHPTPFDVVVKVDTGESIEAHRSVLCALSEVFAAMLSGDFIEAHQSEINLKDLNHATLLFLVHYAYGCYWSFEPDSDTRSIVCPLLEEYLSSDSSPRLRSDRFKIEFDFLLDLLACADRFLLSGLKKQCEQLMIYSLTVEHVADAYLAAVFYNTPRLRVYCLQYIFLGDLELNCVYQCVVRLLESQERDRVIEDFKNIALDCCT